jgi:Tfp pilus assembly protein PilP
MAATALALPVASCGDDGGGAPPPRRPGSKGKKAGKKKKKKAAGVSDAVKKRLIPIGKVDKELRHTFKETDFQPDPTGDINRDPYRSFLLQQATGEKKEKGQQTDICTTKNSRASNYSLRDLRLLGLVLKGTKQYALFRDSAGLGHIVNRGDCLGKEKAIVDDIGAGFVSIEITPDAPQGTVAPPPQKRQIQLHPKELTIDPTETKPVEE